MNNALTKLFGSKTVIGNAVSIKGPGSLFKSTKIKVVNPQTGEKLLNIRIK